MQQAPVGRARGWRGRGWRAVTGRLAGAGGLLCRQGLLHGLLEQGLQVIGGVGGGGCGAAVGPADTASRC